MHKQQPRKLSSGSIASNESAGSTLREHIGQVYRWLQDICNASFDLLPSP